LLTSIRELLTFKFITAVGEYGVIQDILFDDRQWQVKYLVLAVPRRAKSTNILVPFNSIGKFDLAEKAVRYFGPHKRLLINRPIESDPPVSLQKWLKQPKSKIIFQYPNPGFMWGYPPIITGMIYSDDNDRDDPFCERASSYNPHLRSSNEVTGYRVKFQNGKSGRIRDFLIDILTATIQACVIRIGFIKQVVKAVLPVNQIFEISYETSSVKILADKELSI
jgi:hypothetical protein